MGYRKSPKEYEGDTFIRWLRDRAGTQYERNHKF